MSSLLERLRQPDDGGAAWQRFVALYTPLLYSWARRLRLQPDDAADLVQDVFIVLLRELPSFQPTPNHRFRGWLWTITRNKVRELHRRRARAHASGSLADEPAAPDERAENEAAEELALLVRRAAELLRTDFHPSTWKAFWETAVEGRPGKDVAAELGLSIGAVYAARFRVQQRLRQELDGLLD